MHNYLSQDTSQTNGVHEVLNQSLDLLFLFLQYAITRVLRNRLAVLFASIINRKCSVYV